MSCRLEPGEELLLHPPPHAHLMGLMVEAHLGNKALTHLSVGGSRGHWDRLGLSHIVYRRWFLTPVTPFKELSSGGLRSAGPLSHRASQPRLLAPWEPGAQTD
ncbi:unnamed protein product [Pleuronectes platessa]|uniref:Uncharacterized protein n=1 Tax=Pleuronectes platessa TaxID=8262 RepID=A0A9N7YWB9_PLEPL|nr:unnamed protein product [Pleuronectes platessa]